MAIRPDPRTGQVGTGGAQAAAESDLVALKALLLGEEQEEIETLRTRLDDPVLHANDIAGVLPQALRRARPDALSRALEQPLSGTIQRAVRREPKVFADALFPIMGPAIRRAIAEALRGLVQNINRTLDHALSLRGFRWRLEAWRSGVPFGEVVLRHTLAYRVEQAFLIRPGDGLLLQHVADELATGRDADAVSAMLTAIQAFVRDAFAADEPVDSVDMGEHTVWLLHGPHAYLACVIRGLPPRRLRAELADILGDIHATFGPQLEGYAGDRSTLEPLRPELSRCLVSEHKTPEARRRGPSPPLVLLVLVALALLGWLGYERWQQHRIHSAEHARQEQAVQRLRETPGIVLTETRLDPGRLHLRGLRDPLAIAPARLLADSGLDAATVDMAWRPFESAEPVIAMARARQRLQPPPDVTLELTADGRLTARGVAPAAWIERAGLLAATVPGIVDADLSGLLTPDQALQRDAVQRLDPPDTVHVAAVQGRLVLRGVAPAAWIAAVPERLAGTPRLAGLDLAGLDARERPELLALQRRIDTQRLLFAEGAGLEAPQQAVLDALYPDLVRLSQLAASLDMLARVEVIGRTDSIGDPTQNLTLARERALQTVEYLIRAGAPAGLFRLGAEPGREGNTTPDPQQRRVDFRVRLTPSGDTGGN